MTGTPFSADRRNELPSRQSVSGRASPEHVLLAWLLWLPSGADTAAAALAELRRPELQHPMDPRLARLAELLREVAALGAGRLG